MYSKIWTKTINAYYIVTRIGHPPPFPKKNKEKICTWLYTWKPNEIWILKLNWKLHLNNPHYLVIFKRIESKLKSPWVFKQCWRRIWPRVESGTLMVSCNLLHRVVVCYPHHTTLQTSQDFWRILKNGKESKMD